MKCAEMSLEFDYFAFILEFGEFLAWWFTVIYILFKLMDNIAWWLNELDE